MLAASAATDTSTARRPRTSAATAMDLYQTRGEAPALQKPTISAAAPSGSVRNQRPRKVIAMIASATIAIASAMSAPVSLRPPVGLAATRLRRGLPYPR